MAVPEQTPYIEHTGNGATTSFALKFQCESKDHLIVLVDEVEPPIASWSLVGGDVIFTTAPAAGKKITLQRNTPFSRTTDYQSYNNSFRPPAVNQDFDWIWLKLQELGVADWILGARIDALKNYVDRKDDELKAYLMEEIRKQGVALDQLDEYYNYLMQRLAQIAVDKGWDASFVVDGNENQHQINNSLIRTYNSVSDLLAIPNPKHGQIVFARHYDLEQGILGGGGTFIYDSTKAAINDGVVVFNGWVRDTSDKVLTTHDAGLLGDGTDLNQTARLNSLLHSAGDNFTIRFFGEYKTTTNLFVQGFSNLILDGTSCKITGDSENWQWKTEYTPTKRLSITEMNAYYERGIITIFECPNVEVFGFNIKGVGLNNDIGIPGVDAWQDGDAGIATHLCDNIHIHHNKISNTFAWGVFNSSGSGAKAHHNTIWDGWHQSGMNLVVEMPPNAVEKVECYENKIYNIALYGLEFENYHTGFELSCYGNIIDNCFSAIALPLETESGISGVCYENTLTNNWHGVWVPFRSGRIDKNFSITNNVIRGFFRGIYYASSTHNHTIRGNTVAGAMKVDTYRKVSADWMVMRIISPNKFLAQKAAVVSANALNKTWYINGDPHLGVVVTDVEDTPETLGVVTTAGQMVVVTIDKNILTNDMRFRHLHKKVLAGERAETGIHSTDKQYDFSVKNNIVTGCNYPLFKQFGNPETENDEVWAGNTTLNTGVANFYVEHADVVNLKVIKNNLDYSKPSRFNKDNILNGLIETRIVDSFLLPQKTSSDPFQSIVIPASSKGTIMGVRVTFVGASGTTGAIQVNLINTRNYTFQSTFDGAHSQTILTNSQDCIPYSAQETTVTLKSTSTDLHHSVVKIDLIGI